MCLVTLSHTSRLQRPLAQKWVSVLLAVTLTVSVLRCLNVRFSTQQFQTSIRDLRMNPPELTKDCCIFPICNWGSSQLQRAWEEALKDTKMKAEWGARKDHSFIDSGYFNLLSYIEPNILLSPFLCFLHILVDNPHVSLKYKIIKKSLIWNSQKRWTDSFRSTQRVNQCSHLFLP